MTSISPSVDIDRLARRVHGRQSPARLRSSERRRQRLEGWARAMAEEELTLELDSEEGRTAAVDLSGHLPRIRIPSWELPQPLTNYDRPAFDYLMQRTLATHEVGHVRYTDQDAVDAAVAQVDPEHREFFHDIWNALEDGAIEEQLRHEFAVADELAVMNANFGEAGSRGVSTFGMADAIITGCLDLAVYDSGRLGSLLDPDDSSHRFDSEAGRHQFVSDVLPELQAAATDVVSEGDPQARAERVLELWRELADILVLEDMDSPRIDHGGKGDHANQDSGPGERAPDLDDIDPDDASDFMDSVSDPDGDANYGGAESENDDTGVGATDAQDSSAGTNSDDDGALGGEDGDDSDPHSSEGTDADDEDTDTTYQSRDEQNTEGDEGAAGGSTGDGASDGGESIESSGRADDGQPNDHDRPDTAADDAGESDDSRTAGPHSESNATGGGGEISRRRENPVDQLDQLEEEYEALVEEQKQDEREFSDDTRREYEELRRALERIAEEGDRPRELEIAEPTDLRADAWPGTRQTGKQLERILGERLREERHGNIRRGLRSGRIDPRLLTRLKRRDPRVFRQREKPEEKAYVAVLVIDRSGSMGSSIHSTEEATTALACALSSLGIETCVIDVGGRSPRLAKPFGVSPSDSLETLLTGEYGGSTPLSPALRIARERLEDREEFPFVIVVTDGSPNHKDRYRAELAECQFPVLGVYINYGGSSDPSSVEQSADLFDRRRIVTRRGDLETELKELCQGVMF